MKKFHFKGFKKANYYKDAEKLVKKLLNYLMKNEFDVCKIFYNQFKNVMTQIPQAQQIIPLEKINHKEGKKNSVEDFYEFEPEEDEILGSNLLPKNISTQIFKAFLKILLANKVLE